MKDNIDNINTNTNTNEERRTLINKIYELGALLELVDSPSAPAMLPRMLRERLETIYKECGALADSLVDNEEELADAGDVSETEFGSYVIAEEEEEEEVDKEQDRKEKEDKEVEEEKKEEKEVPLNQTSQQPQKKEEKTRTNRKVFTLNDRFLYTRELFGGSKQKFDEAMLELAGMETYEEAEACILEQWEFEAENPTVKSFLGIVARMF